MVEEVRSPLVFGVRDAIRSANSDLSLRLNRANGVLTGKVRLEGISRPVHGVVHQGQNTGRGFFLNGEMAGAARLLITP